MSWLLITVIAYFLNAIASVIDKTMLEKKAIPNPFVYTFYITVLSALLMIFVVPFGIVFPVGKQVLISFLAGAAFTFGLWFMFLSLKKEEATRLTPMIGGLSPIVVLILARVWLKESLTQEQIVSMGFIIVGSFLISLEFNKQQGIGVWLKQKITFRKKYDLPKVRRTLLLALPAAIFFGSSWVLTKDVYNHQNFLSGLVWTRLGAFIVALLPLLLPNVRQAIFKPKQNNETKKTGLRFLVGQTAGGASSLLVQYAVSLTSVSVVQAIQGVQYAFIFVIVFLSTYLTPKFLKEKLSPQIVLQKVIAIGLIGIGLYLII